MFGAIIGDLVGSVYEDAPIKTKSFPFLTECCYYTDETVMTIAVGEALRKTEHEEALPAALVRELQYWGRKYSDAGYGLKFYSWLWKEEPKPYKSYGNGAVMRVSPCGELASTLEEAKRLARISASVTHDHPTAIQGAECVAALIFLAGQGESKQVLKAYAETCGYRLDTTLDAIRPSYHFDSSCEGTVLPAILSFLESTEFEDAIRNAVSLGGDSDTLAAITGSIAWPFYFKDAEQSDEPRRLRELARQYLPSDLSEAADCYENYLQISKQQRQKREQL